MAFTYADVMRRASTILQDNGSVRWTAPELKDWIDQSLVDVHTAKPNAKTQVAQLALVAGIHQQIDADHSMLVSIQRNVGGRRVEVLDNLETLSRAIPNWSDTSVMSEATDVQLVYMDPLTPRSFVVVPPNDGAGELEVIVGLAPTPGAPPATVGDQIDPTKYVAEVDLPDQYQTAVLHLTLYRAFLKDGDTESGNAQAQSHFERGMKALADIIAGEQITAGARAVRGRMTQQQA